MSSGGASEAVWAVRRTARKPNHEKPVLPVSRLATELPRAGTARSRENAGRMRDQGINVLQVVASPRPTPQPHVIEAIEKAAHDHVLAPSNGLLDLRVAIAEKLWSVNGIPAHPDRHVLVTSGAKQGLHILLATLLNRDDEVIVPLPGYLYGGTIRMVGGAPRYVHMTESNGYRLDVDRIEKSIGHRTKALIVNTPGNPSGHVATLEELRALVQIAERHNLLIVADEAHEAFVYDDRKHVSIASLPNAFARTVTVHSFSKGFGLMGHRVGYLAGPSVVIRRARKLLEWSVLTNNFVSQRAAHAVLTGPQDWIAQTVARSEMTRNRLATGLAEFPQLSFNTPEGGTSFFLNVAAMTTNGDAFSSRLLREFGVPTEPGAIFGSKRHVRLSALGSPPDVIDELIDRMGRAVDAIGSDRASVASA